MKINLLITILLFTCVHALVHTVYSYAQEGGAINMDPHLSPNYASYEQQIFNNPSSIFVAVPIILGIISLILVSTHLVLKRKKIPSRQYLLLISAAIMWFLGIPNFIQGIMLLFMISANEHLMNLEYFFVILPLVLVSFGLVGIGAVLLAKSKLIRNFIERK